jgi:hypothetical protein
MKFRNGVAEFHGSDNIFECSHASDSELKYQLR